MRNVVCLCLFGKSCMFVRRASPLVSTPPRKPEPFVFFRGTSGRRNISGRRHTVFPTRRGLRHARLDSTVNDSLQLPTHSAQLLVFLQNTQHSYALFRDLFLMRVHLLHIPRQGFLFLRFFCGILGLFACEVAPAASSGISSSLFRNCSSSLFRY